MPSPPVRVIVRLPYNRPQDAPEIPPRIEWNTEKENILWEVIARSRASDSGGTDWQGLATHLAVPLPYLLFRAQTRYEEDLKGLQGLRGGLNNAIQPKLEEAGKVQERPEIAKRLSLRTTGSSQLASPIGLNSPLSVRVRLNSLSARSRPTNEPTSSVLTLQGARNDLVPTPFTSMSDSPSPSESSSDGEDEAGRQLEEQETLDRKLQHLQAVMNHKTIGLVRDERLKGKGKAVKRRDVKSPTSPLRYISQRNPSSSDLNSTSSSPQGSIPSIPSPPPEQQHLPQSPVARHMTHAKKSSSPPVISSGQARGHAHLQFRPLSIAQASDLSSNQGSSASSFSDISESASLSASALESALLSNIRGAGSRFSSYVPSQFNRRTSGAM